MSLEKLDIIIIRGAPCSGKTQTAKSLTNFFLKGVRLEIDNLRSMVISVNWTNQDEHRNILTISTRLVCDFIKLNFSPVIIIDTFSGGKLISYLDNLNQLNNNLSIRIFGLYTSEEELNKRIESRTNGEFKDYTICHNLNDEVRTEKYINEYQIDTTGLLPIDTAKIIHKQLTDN
jgi:tRNA A37 N6-isopentenylltransferase MiaA